MYPFAVRGGACGMDHRMVPVASGASSRGASYTSRTRGAHTHSPKRMPKRFTTFSARLTAAMMTMTVLTAVHPWTAAPHVRLRFAVMGLGVEEGAATQPAQKRRGQ